MNVEIMTVIRDHVQPDCHKADSTGAGHCGDTRTCWTAPRNVIHGVDRNMEAIFDIVEEYSRGSDHPDLRAYRRDLEGTNPIHAAPVDKVRWVRAREFYCRAGRF